MIQESSPPSSTSEDDFVRLDEDMERDLANDAGDVRNPDANEEDDEPPNLSTVFAVDQLKQGALTAAALFSWGFDAVKEKAAALKETEQVQKMLDSTKTQREAISNNASQLWDSTRPQREEIVKTAASLNEKVQPHLDLIKKESVRAFENISSTVSEAVGGPASSPNQLSRNEVRDDV